MAFIVIEGIDGAGKATQTELLIQALQAKNHACDAHAFPAYETNMGGKLLAELLADKQGSFSSVHPKLASLPYAIDRFESSCAIKKALADGRIVIADRFIGSNQIHQGGKLESIGEKIGYLTWLEQLEHDVLGVSHPDLIIYLKAPVEVSLQLLAEKRASKGGVLADGELDQVEQDRQYLDNSHAMANWLATYYDHWRVIDCVDAQGHIRTREAIHADVLQEVMEIL